MAFTTTIEKEDSFPVILLRNDAEQTVVEIYAFGALLNKFEINSINIIAGFSSPEDAKNNITKGFKGAKLSPFVCRLANGKYVFNNHEHTINKYYLGDEAIHGLLFDAPFAIIESGTNHSSSFVTLQYNYSNKTEGYPFIYTCIVKYRLEKNNRLSIETLLKNNSESPIPVCDGWHPYFTLSASIDELVFKINSEKIVEFNERLLPTGKIIAYTKFQEPEIISDTFLDNCFLLNANNQPACVLRNSKTGIELVIQPDESYPYLQVYTPDHRKSIAIENLSAAPDAFNNKMGLIILKSMESVSFTTTFLIRKQLTDQPPL